MWEIQMTLESELETYVGQVEWKRHRGKVQHIPKRALWTQQWSNVAVATGRRSLICCYVVTYVLLIAVQVVFYMSCKCI